MSDVVESYIMVKTVAVQGSTRTRDFRGGVDWIDWTIEIKAACIQAEGGTIALV